MMRIYVIMLLALWLSGCTGNNGGQTISTPVVAAPPISLNHPVEFIVGQRSQLSLPGSNNRLVLRLGDITRGHVVTKLSWQDGRTVVESRSLRRGDIVTFTASNYVYKIKLKKLTNLLLGQDTAVFQLWPATVEMEQILSENEKIEDLITTLTFPEYDNNATFIRNGKEYTSHEAISHMRQKWEWKKEEIRTADDFIRIVGSKSSVSGNPYLIKMSDGTTITCEDHFKKWLKRIEGFSGNSLEGNALIPTP